MKKSKFAFLLCGLLAFTALCTVPAEAQPKGTDTTVLVQQGGTTVKVDSAANKVTPVFNGTEQNLTDSLAAVGTAITSPEVKGVINDAVKTIIATPKGGGIQDWISWALAALGAIFGLYHYYKRATAKPKSTPQ